MPIAIIWKKNRADNAAYSIRALVRLSTAIRAAKSAANASSQPAAHLNFCKALTAGLLAHEPPLLSRRGPPLPGPLLQRRRGRRRRPFYCIGQRGTSPSPPLEERAGERRAFIRKRWDFLVR